MNYKRIFLTCLALLLCIPGISYAQGFNLGKGVGSSIGQATLGLTNGSNAVSGIKLTTGNFSLAGKATGKNNKSIQGVLMTLSGDINTSASTDKKGKYVFSSLDSGDYTITPSLEGYSFTPKSRDVTITTRNKKNVNFKGRKLLKASRGEKNVSISSLSVLVAPTAETGWPYGEPDEDGYFTINGYKIKFYDASDTVITDVATNFSSVAKIEVYVDESYDVGSVSGSIFAETTLPVSYPLIFSGTLYLAMDSDQFGTLTGTVKIQDCILESGGTFFSSGSINVTTEGSLTTSSGYVVTHSTSGTLNVSGSTFQGTLSLTYDVTGAPVEIGNTVDMTLTINTDGSGSYSSEDENVGSGTF